MFRFSRAHNKGSASLPAKPVTLSLSVPTEIPQAAIEPIALMPDPAFLDLAFGTGTPRRDVVEL